MNFIERLKLKIISDNWEMYGQLKRAQLRKELEVDYTPPQIPLLKNTTFVNFKHSGNAGDIIYAIPAMKAIAAGRKINLFLHLDQPAGYTNHPLGNVTLNQKMADMFIPLIQYQKEFDKCEVYTDQQIDVDLDLVRKAPIHFDKINLSRWYFLTFGCSYDIGEAWLKSPVDERTKGSIVIARSFRYRGKVDYSCLKKYENVQFIGLSDEYSDMKKAIPHIKHLKVSNFLEMASLIAGAKLFIGNQSFPFSVSEGLKVNRLLETFPFSPDVPVIGKRGAEFIFQEHFESLVQKKLDEAG